MNPTIRFAQLVSLFGFLGTLAPAALYAFGYVSLDQVKLGMLAATVAWFVATPVWMDRAKDSAPAETPPT